MIGDGVDIEEMRAGNVRALVIFLRQRRDARQLERRIQDFHVLVAHVLGEPLRRNERIACHG